MEEPEGLRRVMRDLLKTGLALVDGVSATDADQTRHLAQSLALLEETLYPSLHPTSQLPA